MSGKKLQLKKTFCTVFILLTAMFLLLMITSCATITDNNTTSSDDNYKEVQEACQSKNGTGFTDFGDYLIWIDDFESADLESAVSYAKIVSDNTEGGLCTTCVKKNSNGEVLIGRNQDMEVSQNPAFIITTSTMIAIFF